jgi:Protein of unknown function (DUF2490)
MLIHHHIGFKRIVLAAVILSECFMSSVVHAHGIVTEDDGAWMQTVVEGSLKDVDPTLEKVRLWVEGQARFNHDFNQFYQGMLRVGLGYSLSDRATMWAGYNWLPTQQFNKAAISEQDAWTAFRYTLPTELGTVSFRTMLESSFLKGNDVRFRARQMVRFSHPMTFEPRLSVIAWDEAFVRINSTQYGGKSGFDQNRAFAGVGWTVNPNARFELGYMNQYNDDAVHFNNTMQHLIVGSLFVSF